MAEELQVTKTREGRVYVVIHSACQIDHGRILELLAESGIDPSTVTFVTPKQICNITEIEGVPVIIPLDDFSCDAPELSEAARHCGQAGSSVIVVFGEGFPYEGLHPIADEYGTQCGWSPQTLKEKISRDDSKGPSDGTGAKPKRPSPSQVRC